MLFTAKLLTILKSVSFNLWCVFPIKWSPKRSRVHDAFDNRLPLLLSSFANHNIFNSIVKNNAPLFGKHFELFISLFGCCCCCYHCCCSVLFLFFFRVLCFVFFSLFIGFWTYRSFVNESVSICRSNLSFKIFRVSPFVVDYFACFKCHRILSKMKSTNTKKKNGKNV